MLVSINPATGREIARYDLHDAAEVERRVARAAEAFQRFRNTPLEARRAGLSRLAEVLDDRADALGRLATDEMGKPLAQAVAEVHKCAAACRYYADHGETLLAPRPAKHLPDGARAYVVHQPLGPILAVMPWNFPFWQVVRFLAPALLLGNVGLLKHASNVTGCALALEAAVADAGFEGGVFQTLLIEAKTVAGVIADPRVAGATVTGSEGAGRSVGGAAGKALKPSVLELGGSDAFVVLDDADVEHAAAVAAKARCQNNGQSCIAAKRFIAVDAVYDAFAEALVREMEALRVGNPMDAETSIGPIARQDLRDEIADQVKRAVDEGAALLTGGTMPDRTGFFYAPTVLGDVREGTVAFDEEIFGPVASVVRAKDAADAVRLANATRFGLGGSVWTRDVARGERVALELECGSAFVNAMVASHPAVPFGGVKDSGYGRELAAEGLFAFANAKTVWVAG